MLGTALLFWGAMTGNPVTGLVAALVVEAAHWTRLRWDFNNEACSRAWRLSSIAILLVAVLTGLNGNPYKILPALLAWLPPLLLPVQFVQSYGMRDSVPLSSFSMLARRRRLRDKRLGLPTETTWFNFGNVLFATTLVASTVGTNAAGPAFLPGVLILVAWMAFSYRRSSWLALLPVILLSGLLAVAGQFALQKAADLMGNSGARQRGRFNPDHASTLIGSNGTVRQSPEIKWRLRPAEKCPAPKLLRTASYTTFLGRNWVTQRDSEKEFLDLDTILVKQEPHYLLRDPPLTGDLPGLPRFELRGSAAAESPLPLPGNSAALRGFELDGIERNTFGTVRLFPKNPVINGDVLWRGDTNPESPPLGSEDLRVSVNEKQVAKQLAAELGIGPDMPLAEKLAILRTWFHREFRYTRTLTISRPSRERRFTEPSPVTLFLTEVREGHCEYFATAATLLLRQSGTPARYAIGYGVMERDAKRSEFIIRGTHGHAWCRAWDETAGQWVDFDATPTDWHAMVGRQLTRTQRFYDSLKRLREDFFIWRSQPANRMAVSVVMLAIAAAVAAFVARRLWRSRRRIDTQSTVAGYDGPRVLTPLHTLERAAAKHLGPRPAGQTFADWLARLARPLPGDPPLDEAIALHQRIRFDTKPATDADQQRLAKLATQIEAALKRRKPR